MEIAQEDLQKLMARLAALEQENQLLKQKIQFLIHRLFGRRSEKLTPGQLQFLLGDGPAPAGFASPEPEPDPEPPQPGRPRLKKSTPRLPEDLPTEEIVIDPDEVKQNPEAYQCIGEEVHEELDVVPHRYVRRVIHRRKFKRKDDRSQAPVIAPAMPRIVPGYSLASPGLLADIMIGKYLDHLPLARQAEIFQKRYGIDLSRQTLGDWVEATAGWLQLIYEAIRKDLKACGYLQVDETPVRYCLAEGGSSGQGYFWVYHHPGGQVLYEWQTSRGGEGLVKMLRGFSGHLQTDGYVVYEQYAAAHPEVTLLACWAHARRKFYEARAEQPAFAGGVLARIRALYQIERELKDASASPEARQSRRQAESRPILIALRQDLEQHRAAFLPRSGLGEAITYALNRWKALLRYTEHGHLQIDNNGVEGAIRPAALGRKNWLFIGHPQAGDRGAILYTLLLNCKRIGINPAEYLRDVLTRLPTLTNQQVADLTPARWAAARNKTRAA